MDLIRHLEYFIAVVDEGAFSGAAQTLGMAQPPLSQRIRTLESHLHVELFDRSRRQISLTAAGSLLVPEARTLVQAAKDLPLLVARASTGQATVWLDLPSTFGIDAATEIARIIGSATDRPLLPRLMPAAERAKPAVGPHLRVGPGVGRDEVRLPLGIAVAADHPLIRAGTTPHPSDFADAAVLLLDEDDWQVVQLRASLSAVGISQRTVTTGVAPATGVAQVRLADACLITDPQHARLNQLAWFPAELPPRVWRVTGHHAAELGRAVQDVLGVGHA